MCSFYIISMMHILLPIKWPQRKWSVCLVWGMFVLPIPPRLVRHQEHILQRLYELITQISWRIILLLFEKWWSDQITILHMSRQLSCRDMCKFVTWSDYYNHTFSTRELFQFQLWAHKHFAKWVKRNSIKRDWLCFFEGCSKKYIRQAKAWLIDWYTTKFKEFWNTTNSQIKKGWKNFESNFFQEKL